MERFLCNENFVLTPTIDPNPAINHRETRLVGKNGNGEGNIRQRPDGRWEARYCVETPAGLKRRSVYGKTRKDVAEKLAAKIANKDTESVQKVAQTTITVRNFFAEYLAALKDTLRGVIVACSNRLPFRDYDTLPISSERLAPLFTPTKLPWPGPFALFNERDTVSLRCWCDNCLACSEPYLIPPPEKPGAGSFTRHRTNGTLTS